jgi:hypothetical protein
MFRTNSGLLWAAAVAVGLAASVQATEWVADFTSVAPESWSLSDNDAVANYTDTTGANPNSYTVTYKGAGAVPAGWLTQGSRAGTPTTAKFWNAPGANTSGRARFATPLPLSMDGNGGVSVGWTARYGSYVMTRAPVQIAFFDDGTSTGVRYNAYICVQNGTQVRIHDNNGNAYASIDELTLASSVGDGQYHQWSCAVITSAGLAHWKLWVDGVQLLFGNTNGAHTFDAGSGSEQFSFQTASNSFTSITGPSGAYIGLGELNSQDIWDFEFDCVAYKDDGLAMLTCGTTPTCESTVTPAGTQTSTALRASAADPPSHAYTITNSGTTTLDYTAVEMQKAAPAIASLYNTGVDNSRAVLGEQVLDPHWTIIAGGLDGTCTEGAPCSAYTALDDDYPIPPWLANDSTSRWITASPTDGDASAPPGNHVFRTTFTLADQAAVDAALIRGRVAYDDLLVDVKLNGVAVVTGTGSWGFSSWQDFIIDSGFQIGTNTLDFTVQNGGTASNPMGLRVEFFDIVAGDVSWLALDNSLGTITQGNSDIVTASIVDTDLPGGTYTAYVAIANNCPSPTTEMRRIDLTVIDCRSAVSPATNTGRAFLVGSAQTPAPVSYTFENTGAPPVSYTVTSSASWLQLDKPTGVPIGPIAPGGSDVVTGTINVAGLAPGGYVATLTFTDTCNPAVQHIRQVLLSVDEPIATSGDTLQQFKAEFTEFTASDLASQSPLESCDPGGTTDRVFSVGYNSVDSLPAGWLTQGTIDDTPTTAKFNNPDDDLAGRVRFRTFLPFDNTFAPAKGMAVAWNMRIGTDGNARGPIQITFPRVTGPFGTDDATSAVAGEVFNAYVRVNDDAVRILNNGGTAITTIGELTLGTPIAGQYHQWTAAVCYNDADQMAYWNLWLDGEKLMFDGADGSVVGPGGDIFSFRTGLNDVSGDPYVGLGELNSGEDVWDFEFDWVRMLSYNVNGCPFWDGGGSCFSTLPWPDADEDGDVDQADFAVFQLCFSGDGNALSDLATCRRFNRDGDSDVDSLDFNKFEKCATGPGIALDPENPPTGCEL